MFKRISLPKKIFGETWIEFDLSETNFLSLSLHTRRIIERRYGIVLAKTDSITLFEIGFKLPRIKEQILNFYDKFRSRITVFRC